MRRSGEMSNAGVRKGLTNRQSSVCAKDFDGNDCIFRDLEVPRAIPTAWIYTLSPALLIPHGRCLKVHESWTLNFGLSIS